MKTVLIILVITMMSYIYIYAGSKGFKYTQKIKPKSTFIKNRVTLRPFNVPILPVSPRLYGSTPVLKSILKDKVERPREEVQQVSVNVGPRLSEVTDLMNKGQIAASSKDNRITLEAKRKRKDYIQNSLLLFKTMVFDNRSHLGLKGENFESVFEEYQTKNTRLELNLLKDISDGTYTQAFQARQYNRLKKILTKEKKKPNKLIKFLIRTSLLQKEVQFKKDSENGDEEIKNVEEEEYLTQLILQKSWNTLSKNLKKKNINPLKSQRINSSWLLAKKIGQNHRTKAAIIKIQRVIGIAQKEVPKEITEVAGSPLGVKISETYSTTGHVEGGVEILKGKISNYTGGSIAKILGKFSYTRELESIHSKSYEGSEFTKNSTTNTITASGKVSALNVNLGPSKMVFEGLKSYSKYTETSNAALGSDYGVLTYSIISGLLEGKDFESYIPATNNLFTKFYNGNRLAMRGASGKWSKGRQRFSRKKNKITREILESGVNDEEIIVTLARLYPKFNSSLSFGDNTYKRIITKEKVYDNLVLSKSVLYAFDSADQKVWTSHNSKEGNNTTTLAKAKAQVGVHGAIVGASFTEANNIDISKSYRESRRLVSPHNMVNKEGAQLSRVVAQRNIDTIFTGFDTIEKKIKRTLEFNAEVATTSAYPWSKLDHNKLSNQYTSFRTEANIILKFLLQDSKLLKKESKEEVEKAFNYFKDNFNFNFNKKWISSIIKKGIRYRKEIPAHILREGIVKVYNIFSTIAGNEELIKDNKDFRIFLEKNPLRLPIERVVEYSKFQKILYAAKHNTDEPQIISPELQLSSNAKFSRQKKVKTRTTKDNFTLGANSQILSSQIPEYIPELVMEGVGNAIYQKNRIKAVSFANLNTTNAGLTNVQEISTEIDTVMKKPKGLTSLINKILRNSEDTRSKTSSTLSVVYKTPEQLVKEEVSDPDVLFKEINKLGRKYTSQQYEASTSQSKSGFNAKIDTSLLPIVSPLSTSLSMGVKSSRSRGFVDSIERHSLGNDLGFLGIVGNKLLQAPPVGAPTNNEHIYDHTKWESSRKKHRKSLGEAWMNVANNNPKFKDLIFGAKGIDHVSAVLSKIRNEGVLELDKKAVQIDFDVRQAKLQVKMNKMNKKNNINKLTKLTGKLDDLNILIKQFKNSKGTNLVPSVREERHNPTKGANYLTHIQNLYPEANFKDAVDSWKKKYNRENLDTMSMNNMLSTLVSVVYPQYPKNETIQQYLKRASPDKRFSFYKNEPLGKQMFEQYIESMLYIVSINNYYTQNQAYQVINNNIPTYRRGKPNLKAEARKAFGFQE